MLFNDEPYPAQSAGPQIFIQPNLFLFPQNSQIRELLGEQDRLSIGLDRAAYEKTDQFSSLPLRQCLERIFNRKMPITLSGYISGLNVFQADDLANQTLAAVE